MSSRDDEIEFDFFDDEPETEQQTQRRPVLRPRPSGPRPGGGGPRGPQIRAPQGFAPILRLVLLIALALFVVILLVFWIQSCREQGREAAYRDYMEDMSAVARASDAIATDLNDQLTTPGINQEDLINAIEGLTRRQEQVVRNAQDVDPPGPLRDEHEAAIEALQFRVSGLNGLAVAFDETPDDREAADAGALLATQAERLVASDVIWDDLFADPSRDELESQGITGVPVPDSNSIKSADLASQRSMVALWQRLQSAARGGTPTGLHGTSIVSTVALPSGEQLTTSGDNIVEASQDLAFRVTVQNSGDGQEVGIDVTLLIQKSPEPIEKTETIDIINPGETKTVTFEDLGEPPLGPPTQLKVTVAPVPGEARTQNNTAAYQVVFSFPR